MSPEPRPETVFTYGAPGLKFGDGDREGVDVAAHVDVNIRPRGAASEKHEAQSDHATQATGPKFLEHCPCYPFGGEKVTVISCHA